jgi:hypothetical protein
MGDDRSARIKQHGLQQAASVIFALVAVVPLLIFAWTLHALGVVRSTQAQLSLGLALGVALLGYWMFRSLLGQMAGVVQALTAVVEQASRPGRPAPAVAAARPGPALGAAGEAARPPAAVAAPTVAAEALRAVAASAASPARAVAGLGTIRELTEVVRTMDTLWYREATAHLNQRVQISVANSREPLVGTLTEATSDGLILDQADGQFAIAYGRVTAIDRLS